MTATKCQVLCVSVTFPKWTNEWLCMTLQFMSSAGGTCYLPPRTFFRHQEKPSPEMLDYSEGFWKCLTSPTEPPASSFLMTKKRMKVREQKHCIFNLCPVYCKQQTILGWQSEVSNFWHPAEPSWGQSELWQVCIQEHCGTCSRWPLHYNSWSDFLEDFLNLKTPETEETGCLLPLLGAAFSSTSLHRWLVVQRARMNESGSPPNSDWSYHFQLSQW